MHSTWRAARRDQGELLGDLPAELVPSWSCSEVHYAIRSQELEGFVWEKSSNTVLGDRQNEEKSKGNSTQDGLTKAEELYTKVDRKMEEEAPG